MFLYAYTPSVDDTILIEQIHEKIDELAEQDMSAIEPLYDQIVSIREAKSLIPEYSEQKMFILLNLETYLFDRYINTEQSKDLITDSSLFKFVSRWVPYQNISYIPADLVMLFPTATISIAASEELSYMMISQRALPWLQEMSIDFESKFGYPMLINSARRSYEYQRDEFTQECRDSGLCAEPGYSEHQWGLSVDINGMYGDPYIWMSENAHRYGFHQSYQNGFEIDGYNIENWHWRYLGVDFATELHEAWITFTQWVRIQNGEDPNGSVEEVKE